MNSPLLSIVSHCGPVARSVLVLLLIESIVAWAVIINRLWGMRKIREANRRFRMTFDQASSLSDVANLDAAIAKSPLARLARIGAGEVKRVADDARVFANVKQHSSFFDNQFGISIHRFESAIPSISASIDRGVFLLAIISSSAPFLGLLGTVWGIMDSFFQIGYQQSASLLVVAPGIAEALISTLAGLAVAIPAVFFYNYLMQQANRIDDQLDEFKEDLFFRFKNELFSLLYAERSETSQIGQRKDA